jgi:PadR family transcriptional regulator, regulatory protein PadR
MVLQALASGYEHGFDIIDLTGLASGTVYPILRRLERRGLVRSEWEDEALARAEGRPQRRCYEITGAGRKVLSEVAERYPLLARSVSLVPRESNA